MRLPFTVEQFFDVLESHNVITWPAPLIAYVLGIAALLYAVRKTPMSDSVVCSVLAVFWIWMGAVYHIAFFAVVNKAAYAFGAAFLLQGGVFLVVGAMRGRVSFAYEPSGYFLAGVVLVLYAMVVYPMLGSMWGHSQPRAPGFGVAPCPTTIFTFGLLLWTTTKVPKYMLVVPAVWSLIGFSAALQLGAYEDFGLVAAGLIGTALILYRDRQPATLRLLDDGHDV